MAAEQLRLLLIEDSDDDALLITTELEMGGYAVSHRRILDRESLLQALQSDSWDIIISDHSLPGFSSTEALLLLLEQEYDIPFIIVSGTIGEEQAVEAMKAGARDYVMKDKLNRLVPAVRNAINEAIEVKRRQQVEEAIKHSRKRLRELASHLETVREEERRMIARDIHDDLGGILTAVKMDVGWLKRWCPDCSEAMQDKLQAMGELVDSAIRSVRRIITELRPSILDDLGLIPALEWQLNDFKGRYPIDTDMELQLGAERYRLSEGEEFPPAVTKRLAFVRPEHVASVFRIFQEALTNVARHSEASRIEVRVVLDEQRFELTIDDDGVGINEDTMMKSGSYGILGMHERALHMGGDVEVATREGSGTRVRIHLPLNNEGGVDACAS